MNKKEVKTIYIIFSIGLIILIFSGLAIGYSYSKDTAPKMKQIEAKEEVSEGNQGEPLKDDKKEEINSVTGLLLGNDGSGSLVDVIMVGHLNIDTNEVNIISVPRDLFIDFREDHFKELKANNPNNRVLYCKLTEVYSLIGNDEQAFEDLISIIEIIVDLEIDYYMTLGLDSFKDIVDFVDGVDFYVPQNMSYYDDIQDFRINLREGQQLLDGDKAEQLVRFRNYRFGDLQRVEVQRDFLSELVNKVLSESSMQENFSILEVIYNNVETDIAFFDVMKYAKYIINIDNEQLMDTEKMVTIPSYGFQIDNIWFQEWHIEEAHEVVNALLNE
ncbi:LytR family transcriptional attenuator [Natranaerovirga hydrolytica]|uniref:LytR family transcriptional attenuator n=1 Tax=Natranaerovirga hydrolytica TaxID=680378 RepID=A0A4R1MLP2_9FIRM|nr:LCP family protein [Natranaerovirga hydrolytica]TCK93455.1 LytR family transcriptional attenuator [Natranaerovirga hydrolytica]